VFAGIVTLMGQAAQSQCRLPAIVITISSRCQRAVGDGCRFRKLRENSAPNLQTSVGRFRS